MEAVIAQKWSNQDNHQFYDHLGLDIFQAGALRSGLPNGEDIKQIRDLIKSSSSILEVGAGYGRVLKYVLEMGYRGKFDAVEFDEGYFEYCKNRYGHYVNIFRADILEWKSEVKYDLILWMWSGIIEFFSDEQAELFKFFSSILNPGGSLVVELKYPEKNDVDRIILDGQQARFTYKRPGGYLYFPSREQLLAYSDKYFDDLKIQEYYGCDMQPRLLHIFKMSSCC